MRPLRGEHGFSRRRVPDEEGAALVMETLATTEITSIEEYEKITGSHEYMSVIWFYSTWSRPCQQMAVFWEVRIRAMVFYTFDSEILGNKILSFNQTVTYVAIGTSITNAYALLSCQS